MKGENRNGSEKEEKRGKEREKLREEEIVKDVKSGEAANENKDKCQKDGY